MLMSDYIYSVPSHIKNGFIDCQIMSTHNFERYFRFLEGISNRKTTQKTPKENHHICPISISKKLKNNRDNLISVSPREHFIAHFILAKAIGGKQWFSCNIIAKCNNPFQERKDFHIFNSKLYEISKMKEKEVQREIISEQRQKESGEMENNIKKM